GQDVARGVVVVRGRVGGVRLEECLDLGGGGRAAGLGLKDVLDEPRVGLAGEADAAEDAAGVEELDGGALEGEEPGAAGLDERPVDVEEVEHQTARRASSARSSKTATRRRGSAASPRWSAVMGSGWATGARWRGVTR